MGAKTDRRHAQGEESRARILDATIEIASQRGYQGTSIAAVSERSGLPASSIYWHFRSKDDLVAAVIERSFEAWLDTFAKVHVPDGGTLRERIVAGMINHGTALAESPEFLRLGLMLALEQHPQEPTARAKFLAVRGRSFDSLVEVFAGALVELHGRDDQERAQRLATAAMAGADGLFVAHQVDPEGVDLAGGFELLAEMIVTSLDRPPR